MLESEQSSPFALLTSHGSNDLVRHVPDVIYRERLEVVLFEEIVGAEAKQLEGNANMAVVIKRVQHVNTRARREERKHMSKSHHFEMWPLQINQAYN